MPRTRKKCIKILVGISFLLLYQLSICHCQKVNDRNQEVISEEDNNIDTDFIGSDTNVKSLTNENVKVNVKNRNKKPSAKVFKKDEKNETVANSILILLDSDGDDVPVSSTDEKVLISSCCNLHSQSRSPRDFRDSITCGGNVKITRIYKEYLDSANAFYRQRNDQIKNADIWTIWAASADLVASGEPTDFILQEMPLFCNKEIFLANLPYNSSNPKRNWILPNGYLRIGNEFYAPDEFCINGFTPENVEVKVCSPDCGQSRACIPKCCPPDKIYSTGVSSKQNRGCRSAKNKGQKSSFFNPQFYHDFHRKLTPSEMSLEPKPHFYSSQPSTFRHKCWNNKTVVFPNSASVAEIMGQAFNVTMHSINFKIRKDGAFLYVNSINKKCVVERKTETMCFDGIQDYGSDVDFSNSEEEILIFLCNNWNSEVLQGHSNELIYGILMVTVSVFPFLTCLVYLLLWKRQNVHGWTIAATTGALFFMYVFQGAAFIIAGLYGREKLGTWSCIFIGIIGHFFFLATFSWLTVMCCDLWWTFRMLTPTNRRSKGRSRYIKYSIFGWGLPIAFVSTGVILDFTLKSEDCTIHTLPMYGEQSCWVTPSSQGLYTYYPVAVLLSLNIFFFAVTCYKLCRYRKNTKFATKKDTDHWQGFTRFIKLFLVMGVSWIFEVLAWSIDGLKLQWYWIVFDIINIMRAIGIFVVYVCKQDILSMLEDTHPPLKKFFRRFKRSSDDISEHTGSTGLQLNFRMSQ